MEKKTTKSTQEQKKRENRKEKDKTDRCPHCNVPNGRPQFEMALQKKIIPIKANTLTVI